MKLNKIANDGNVVSAEIEGLHGKYAIILFLDKKQFYCSCVGYKTHKKACKHIKYFFNYLNLNNVEEWKSID